MFQNQFGRSDIPGSATCDFKVDGHCDLLDYKVLISVLRGPICDCAKDTDCDDSYLCTADDCYSGMCRHRVTCPNQDDADADCIHEYCTIAGCVAADEPDFSLCVDGVACTFIDYCKAGQCRAGIPVDSYWPNGDASDADCFFEVCNPTSGCVSNPVFQREPAGSPCDDGIPCTTRSVCTPGQTPFDNPVCVTQSPDDLDHSLCPNSDDNDADCWRENCDPTFGCIPDIEPSGSPCQDEIACTNVDVCSSNGTCYGSKFENALCANQNDNDADCVRENCNDLLGCLPDFEPPGSLCQDGIACTIVDVCSSGTCLASKYDHALCGGLDDSDRDCQHGRCEPDIGCIEQRPEANGSPCGDDDGVACTNQYCIAGQCAIVPIDLRCDDHDADADCIRANCDPDFGCFLAIEPDGSPCEDGIACTGSDSCGGGQCYAGIYYDFLCPNQDYCDDDCVQYYCQPGQGCVPGAEFESAPCLDFFCTINDQYSACNATGACECRAQQPPDFGCP